MLQLTFWPYKSDLNIAKYIVRSDTLLHTHTNSYLSVTWFKACRQWVRHSISNTLYILTHIVLVKQKISR